MKHLLSVVLTVGLTGCVIGSEKYLRPRDLPPSSLVDRTRILAIKAEPPEIFPGQGATFEVLLPQPDLDGDEPWPRIWLACPPTNDGGIGFGCDLDLAGATGSTGTVGTAVPDGLIGFQPGWDPAYFADPDILEPFAFESERDLAEGVQVLVQVAAMPPEVLQDTTGAELDFNQVEVGYKRLVVSEASTPNRNPEIDEFVIDRLSVPVGSVVHVTAEQTYEIGVILEESLIEEYEYLNRDGVVEDRTEEPYATWFSTGGEILEPITLYPYTESTWTAPAKRGTSGTWYAVVRDRRGGMDWHVQDWVVD